MSKSVDVTVNPTTLRLRADALFMYPDAVEEQLRGAATLIESLKAELATAKTISTSPPAKYHKERIIELEKERVFARSFEESTFKDGNREVSASWAYLSHGLADAIFWHKRLITVILNGCTS